MYALVSLGGICNLFYAGFVMGAVARPDLSPAQPFLIALLIAFCLWAGLTSAGDLNSGQLRRTVTGLFFRHIPASRPADPDDE